MNKLVASFKLQNKNENLGLERMTSIFFFKLISHTVMLQYGKRGKKRIHAQTMEGFLFYYQQGNSIGLVKSGHLNA